MIRSGGYIDCSKNYPNSNRKTPFFVVSYTLDYVNDINDRSLIDDLLDKAHLLALQVCRGRANDSKHNRTQQCTEANCLAGVISEHFWLCYLNEEKEIVQPTIFEGAANQIDLEVIDTKAKIEVRSSFPRNGCEFAICDKHEFRIVGPYSNTYKKGEVQKDFYVGALFHLSAPELIFTKIKQSKFTFYLTGGATWDMMWDAHTSIVQELIPEDSFGIQIKTTYRVVPYSKALDAKEIKEAIQSSLNLNTPQYRILNSVTTTEQFTSYLPLYSIRAACGYFGEGEQVDATGWMKAEGIGRLNRNMYIVRAVGHSMEPRIHDGDYCVFQANPAGSREGTIVLAQHHGYFDEDNAGSYSIKEYHSEKSYDEDGNWQHEKIVLKPFNRDYNPIELTPDDIDTFRIVGGFVGIIKPEEPHDEPMICPNCGGQLVERKGPYGAFYGCSNYPKCHYMQKI